MSKPKPISEATTYESAMKELTTIVEQLQNDDIGIDTLAEKVKRASELIAFCRQKLRQTEEDIDAVFT